MGLISRVSSRTYRKFIRKKNIKKWLPYLLVTSPGNAPNKTSVTCLLHTPKSDLSRLSKIGKLVDLEDSDFWSSLIPLMLIRLLERWMDLILKADSLGLIWLIRRIRQVKISRKERKVLPII